MFFFSDNISPSAQLDEQLKEIEEKVAKYEKLLKVKEDLKRLEARVKALPVPN